MYKTNLAFSDQPIKQTTKRKLPASRIRLGYLLVFTSCMFLLLGYIWLISYGTWTKWPNTTNYYDQLAGSFIHGSLSLEIKPDAALLALPNPYDPSARTGLQVPTDISFFKGKFFLYFGPVPGLILLIVRVFGRESIGDQYLVFSFITGIILIQSLLIFHLWKRFFSDLTPWLLPPSMLAAGLICPVGWILSLPTVYNAAISGGAFFFLAGFFAAIKALDRSSISRWGLVTAGILWTAAVGSRITQILPVGFMTIMAIILVLYKQREKNPFSKSIPSILALAVPLGVGLTGLCWYNWARFGSIFETGITYQLAGPYLQKYQQDLFSPVYILQNIYNYLLIPPKVKSAFPFLIPVYGNIKPILSFLTLPKIYYSQEITGYLYSAPFITLAIIPMVHLFSQFKRAEKSKAGEDDRQLFTWLSASLLGSFLIGFTFFLVFFWVAMRYFLDFIPPLVLLSIIGFWQGTRHFAIRPAGRLVFILFAISLIGISIASSNLLALSINSGRFREFNPVLWRHLVNAFRR